MAEQENDFVISAKGKVFSSTLCDGSSLQFHLQANFCFLLVKSITYNTNTFIICWWEIGKSIAFQIFLLGVEMWFYTHITHPQILVRSRAHNPGDQMGPWEEALVDLKPDPVLVTSDTTYWWPRATSFFNRALDVWKPGHWSLIIIALKTNEVTANKCNILIILSLQGMFFFVMAEYPM